MRSTTQVLYLGTYERDYPRNRLMIAALRHAGCDVVEVHAPIWAGAHDKTALLSSPRALSRLGLNLAHAYSRLIVRTLRRISHADIVCFGYIGQLDLLILGPLARLAGKPVVFNPLVTLSDTLIEDRRKFAPQSLPARMIRLIDRLSLALADVVLVDTAENGAYLTAQFGISPERLHVVPVGADETLFTMRGCCAVSDDSVGADRPAHENQPASGERCPSVLFYGNMIPLQGVDTIVRAAALLRDEAIRFEIIGSGQTYEDVRALADQLGATNITWTGRIPYADLPRRIADADVLLGIFGDSDKAGRVVPNKVYQAMAMGAAIVTRDSSAQRSLLTDGVSALLLPPADPAALAEALRRLGDPQLRCRLGEAARQRFVACASLDVQAERLRAALAPLEVADEARRAGSVAL